MICKYIYNTICKIFGFARIYKEKVNGLNPKFRIILQNLLKIFENIMEWLIYILSTFLLFYFQWRQESSDHRAKSHIAITSKSNYSCLLLKDSLEWKVKHYPLSRLCLSLPSILKPSSHLWPCPGNPSTWETVDPRVLW